MYSTSSLDVICVVVVVPDPMTFLCIPASDEDVAVVNPNRIKTVLANYIFH